MSSATQREKLYVADVSFPAKRYLVNELNWRKTMQDTFSHNRSYFVSGKKVFGRTGFWRISDKAPLHNILKDSSHNINTEAARAPSVVKPKLRRTAVPVAQTPTVKPDFSSMDFLLAAIDSLSEKYDVHTTELVL